MRTTEPGEICISNDNKTIGEEGFYLKQKGEEREQTDGETERERERVCVCVCVCVCVDRNQQHRRSASTTASGRETHLWQ